MLLDSAFCLKEQYRLTTPHATVVSFCTLYDAICASQCAAGSMHAVWKVCFHVQCAVRRVP